MQQQVTAVPIGQTPTQQGNEGVARLSFGTLGKLACKCSVKNDMDFLIKKDMVVCASCGSEIACVPPLVGVFYATCNCCASAFIKSTFVLDSRGIYTCTWCGRTR
jgi:hypothetical protein